MTKGRINKTGEAGLARSMFMNGQVHPKNDGAQQQWQESSREPPKFEIPQYLEDFIAEQQEPDPEQVIYDLYAPDRPASKGVGGQCGSAPLKRLDHSDGVNINGHVDATLAKIDSRANCVTTRKLLGSDQQAAHKRCNSSKQAVTQVATAAIDSAVGVAWAPSAKPPIEPVVEIIPRHYPSDFLHFKRPFLAVWSQVRPESACHVWEKPPQGGLAIRAEFAEFVCSNQPHASVQEPCAAIDTGVSIASNEIKSCVPAASVHNSPSVTSGRSNPSEHLDKASSDGHSEYQHEPDPWPSEDFNSERPAWPLVRQLRDSGVVPRPSSAPMPDVQIRVQGARGAVICSNEVLWTPGVRPPDLVATSKPTSAVASAWAVALSKAPALKNAVPRHSRAHSTQAPTKATVGGPSPEPRRPMPMERPSTRRVNYGASVSSPSPSPRPCSRLLMV